MDILLTGFVLIFYFNLVLYTHLRDLTNVYDIKDYFKYNSQINVVMNITFTGIIFMCWLTSSSF